jgi:tRNA_anti-like
MQDYKKNEAEADDKYLEKTITVTGTIESISHLAGEITIALKELNEMAGVLCYFPLNVIDTSLIKVGSEVTIKGKCQGYFIDVLLTDCVLQK